MGFKFSLFKDDSNDGLFTTICQYRYHIRSSSTCFSIIVITKTFLAINTNKSINRNYFIFHNASEYYLMNGDLGIRSCLKPHPHFKPHLIIKAWQIHKKIVGLKSNRIEGENSWLGTSSYARCPGPHSQTFIQSVSHPL